MKNTNKTILLTKLLGLNPPTTMNLKLLNTFDKTRIYQLYLHAKMNKLDYLFLKSLEFAGVIERYRFLKDKLLLYDNIFNKFVESILNVSNVLSEMGIHYAFVKTIYDMPVLPGDIDVLIEGQITMNIIDALKSKGFLPFDKGPHFVSVYNTNVDNEIPRLKRSYDIDIYDEMSLNHLIYLDKNQLMKEIEFKRMNIHTSFQLDDNDLIPVLSPEYELMVDINHALFEQLFTLLHLYIILLTLRRVELNKLIDLIYKTKSFKIMKHSMNIVICVLKSVFPEEIFESGLASITDIAKLLEVESCNFRQNMELPYRFKLVQVGSVIVEKASMHKFSKGLLLLILNTLNPSEGGHIVRHVVLRRKRLTY